MFGRDDERLRYPMVVWKSCAVPLALVCGCGFEAPRFNQVPDAAPDAALDGALEPTETLLLSEVQALGAFEFIEIYNPTSAPIVLTDYYLTDSNEYWKLPEIGHGVTLALSNADFIVRFPAGATIAAGGVATIAVDGDGFNKEYGLAPTYSIANAIDNSAPMLAGIPAASLPMSNLLTNEGEFVVLFHWDGASDLVQDVDIIVFGNAPDANAGNTLIPKQPVDGPDADSTPSSYALDRGLIGDFMADPQNKASFKRIMRETGFEQRAVDGNGISGDDETSELTRMTWEEALTAGTPGTIPSTLR